MEALKVGLDSTGIPGVGWRRLAWAAIALGMLFAVGAALAERIAAPIHYDRQPFEWRLPQAFPPISIVVAPIILWHARGTVRDFGKLVLRRSDSGSAKARREILNIFPAAAGIALIMSLASSAVIQELNTQRWTRFASGDWNAFDLVSATMVTANLAVVTMFYAFLVSTSARMGRAGRDLVELRPFESRAFDPLVQYSFRTVLLFVVVPMVSFGVQYVFQGGAGLTLLFWMMVSVVLTIACILIPTRALTTRLRDWKKAEIDRVAAAIEGDRSQLRESRMHEQLDDLDLLGLLAYRREVDSLRVTPLDRSSVVQFVLYGLIPPASWVAAALVERLLDQLLD